MIYRGDDMLSGFPPVARADARVLVLGSMPGARSLAERQYYAQPRNAFWPIMGALFGAGPELGYAERLARLTAQGIALWDVLAHCRREGSLDQRIELASAIVNDFRPFLATHPRITHVFFNGRMAQQLFRRLVLPGLPDSRALALATLPSTSPAMASLDRESKLAQWQVVRSVVANGS
jgi:TDG/mug DNA glycosylase family protein